jgi:phasin
MSTEGSEVPSSVRELAEKSVEQARGAVGTLLDAARKTSDAIQSSTKTGDSTAGQAVARGFGYAEQNISAIFDFAQKLVKAPDLKEAARLQADFVREQAEVMSKQVEELKGLSDKKD